MSRRFFEPQNRNARIGETPVTGTTLEVETRNRDEGTMVAVADVRLRNDTETGRSLTGLEVTRANGRSMYFTGPEARTLLRVLQAAAGN